tara:strand:- start:144 stop:344 length:201 start_codon:yes stop_codon:yes gene_type:complete
VVFCEYICGVAHTTWASAKQKDLIGTSSIFEAVRSDYYSTVFRDFFVDHFENEGARNYVKTINRFV